MVHIAAKKTLVKIMFWGLQKDTENNPIDILCNITKSNRIKDELEINFTGNIIRLPFGAVETLSFLDRVIFQSTTLKLTYYHVYNITIRPNSENQIKQMFIGTDGIIFIFNGEQSNWQQNVENLTLLKKIVGSKLLEKVPMTIILTKSDVLDAVNQSQLRQLLKTEGLLPDQDDAEGMRNPMIFEADIGDPTSYEVYQAFAECARRIINNWMVKGGSTLNLEKTARINLIIPDNLKKEWEHFSSEIVHASMSQMIRDAVRDYMKKMKGPNPPPERQPEIPEGEMLEEKIERIVSKKLETILKKNIIN